ncbi:MAG: cupredoxin domain-containing protein, partial [Pseudomonadota bacterium]
MNKRLLIVPFVALILFSANAHSSAGRASIETTVAISNAGNPEKVTRIIKITQVDNMFLPAEIAVTAGETVKFVIKNGGSRKHEMLIAPMADLKKYAKMRRNL